MKSLFREGMIPFVKPGTSGTYQEMGEQAVRLALEDSGASCDQVQQVYAGYVYSGRHLWAGSRLSFGNERNSGDQCQYNVPQARLHCFSPVRRLKECGKMCVGIGF